jgi:copper transport protein
MKQVILCAVCWLWGMMVVPVSAHANLQSSFPTANAQIETSPSEIRLTFTEPLEPSFSRITVIDSTGNTLAFESSVDVNNALQMVIDAPNLSEGVYTVSWRAVSATDGHTTKGSYAFIVGQQHAQTPTFTNTSPPIPLDSSLIRALNLLAFSAFGGALGFYLLVWRNILTSQPFTSLFWLTWLGMGIVSVLMLMMQVSLYNDVPLLASLNTDWGVIVFNTRFGTLWLIRQLIWFIVGVCLFLARYDHRVYWLTLVGTLALLLVHSLFSHAINITDGGIAVISQWLHLTATVFWLGGLGAFLLAIGIVWRTHATPIAIISQLVAYFSNLGRVCVITLFITGVYATWVQVGSLEALLNTPYGLALLVKSALFLPVLAIATINLLHTSRRLRQNQAVWVGRLRGLMLAEVGLISAILLVVGVMTSINPAKTQYEFQVEQAQQAQSVGYFEMQVAPDGMMVHLDITPNQLGENTFSVSLYDENGDTITDATRIRMRFENKQANVGRSELRPELQADGTYQVKGANLSLAGEWTIRLTIKRPRQFDAIVAFVVPLGE